jgi:hypothetical protein
MIRDFKPEDLCSVLEIHKEQKFDYSVPDLSSPLVLVKKVREVDGRVVAVSFIRVTAETFLLVQGSPVEKARSIEELQPEILREAYEKGLSEIVCVLPPEISESFAPALKKLGWEPTRDWPMWQRNLE